MSDQNKIIEKNPKLYNMIKKNNIRILILGVSSLVVLSDIVFFFSVLTEMTLVKYVLTMFIEYRGLFILYYVTSILILRTKIFLGNISTPKYRRVVWSGLF